jgi:hypothetical protein
MDEERLLQLMKELSILPDTATRIDSGGYTKNLADALTAVKVRTYDQIYTPKKARTLIPVNNGTNTGAEKIKYYSWDSFGMSQVISNYADDLPLVSALRQEFEEKVEGFGQAYQYSIQDIRRAAMSGEPLQQRDSAACRMAFEQTVEAVGAVGHADTNLKGLANNPNVTIYSPTTGTWASATGLQMAQDMVDFVYGIVAATKETFAPTRILLDLVSYNHFMSTPTTTTGDTAKSAHGFFQELCPYSVMFESWNRLALADAAGTGPRAVAYPYDPMVLEFEIPQEYEEFPPERKSLAFNIPTHGRIGGVIIYYPVAVGYMDGL